MSEYIVKPKKALLQINSQFWLGEIVKIDDKYNYLNSSIWIEHIGDFTHIISYGKPSPRRGQGETICHFLPKEMVVRIPRDGAVVIDWPFPLWTQEQFNLES